MPGSHSNTSVACNEAEVQLKMKVITADFIKLDS
jgi:hypothetical protein